MSAIRSVANLAANSKIGPFRIVRQLGAGGMGVVYEAFDESKKRKIALKIVLPNALVNDNAVARFQAEGRALAKMNHPNVITLYELTEHEGMQVLAMEYVDGQPLDMYLLDRPCGMADLIEILRQIAEGLQAAHREKIIHRDLKPANILITSSVNFAGNVRSFAKIIDFGVSKLGADPEGPKTATDVILGTANYIAPEVLLGAEPTPQTDVYSLGLIFWQILTGRIPFEGRTNVDVVRRILNETLELPPKLDSFLSPSLRQLFKKMTAKEYRARYNDMSEVLQELKRISYEPMPQALCSAVQVPVVISNQAEIRGRLKLQGFDPFEANFIMKLALEQESGPVPVRNVTAASTSQQLPQAILKENALVKAVEQYRSLRSQMRAAPREPSEATPPAQEGSFSQAREVPTAWERVVQARKRDGLASWIVVGVAILISIGLISRVIAKKRNSAREAAYVAVPETSFGALMSRLQIASRESELPPLEASLPAPQTGDTYTTLTKGTGADGKTFERNESWTAISVTGDRVVWENRGRSKLSYVNPFLEPIRLLEADGAAVAQTLMSGGRTESISEVEAGASDLFPLFVGKQFKFKRVLRAGTADEFSSEASCRVTSREVIKTAITNFDTYRVTCEAKDDAGSVTEGTFWYSPLAQRSVRSEEQAVRADGSRAWTRTGELQGFRYLNGNALRAP